jgi:hypothetical protein
LISILAPDQRDVPTLRVVAGLSLEETASVPGKTARFVKLSQCPLNKRVFGLAERSRV